MAACTSRNLHCAAHALFCNRLPALIVPDLVVRQRESLHACWVSHTRARISHEVHIRFCPGLPSESPLMRSEISEKRHLHSLQPFKYIFRKTLGAGARLGSIADTATVLMDAACTATSAACAVGACIRARFARCALRACVAAAATCVEALAARTASFDCACCSLTNWRSHSTKEPSGPFASLPGTTGGVSVVHAVVVCTGLFCHWLTALWSVTFLPAEDVHKPGSLARSLVLLGNCPESSLHTTKLFFSLSWPGRPQQLFTSTPCLTTLLLNCKQT